LHDVKAGGGLVEVIEPAEMVQRSIGEKSPRRLEFCCVAQRLGAINSAFILGKGNKSRDSHQKFG
jgi:hypothetical protein